MYPSEQAPATHVIEPSARHTHTLVYLHGFTCSGADYVATPHFFPRRGLRVVLPDADTLPITCYGGEPLRAWYDYLTDHGGEREDEACMSTLHATCERLAELVAREVALLGGDHSRLLLGGCSQGCATAFYLLANYIGLRIGGFIGTVGHIFTFGLSQDKSEWKSTPAFFYNSLSDTVMRWSWVQPTLAALQAAGAGDVHTVTCDNIAHSETGEEEGKWITHFLRHVMHE